MKTGAGITRAPAVVIDGGAGQSRVDDVVIEAPLEIRVAGDPVTTTMRTPGEDRFLALGNLFCEGVIARLDDVGSVAHCGRPDDPRYGDTIEVTPGPGARLDLDRLERARRTALTTSACGICGRDGIEDLKARLRPLPARRVPGELLTRAPELLAQHQPNFARTGGLHAAAAVDAAGQVVAFAEDIGRHNAADKVVGKLLYAHQLPALAPPDAAPVLMLISGRASFEMVQKAATAGFVALVSVSAASSLAITTAQEVGLTLAAFARAGRFTIYSCAERVVLP